jgi:hypothetical protein
VLVGNPWVLVGSQAVAASLVALALRRPGVRGSPRPDGSLELRYPAAARRATLVAPVLVLAGTVTALGTPRSGWTLAIGLLTVAVLLLVRVEIAGVRVRLLADGIEQSSTFVHPTALRWSEITGLEWSPLARSFVLTGPPGRVMVSAHLEGLGDFARAIRANVPLEAGVAAPDVRPRLAALASRLDEA